MVLFTIIDFHDGTGHRQKVLFSFVLIVNQNTRLDYFVVLFLLGHPVINMMLPGNEVGATLQLLESEIGRASCRERV